jgi:hypothetical protein
MAPVGWPRPDPRFGGWPSQEIGPGVSRIGELLNTIPSVHPAGFRESAWGVPGPGGPTGLPDLPDYGIPRILRSWSILEDWRHPPEDRGHGTYIDPMDEAMVAIAQASGVWRSYVSCHDILSHRWLAILCSIDIPSLRVGGGQERTSAVERV